MAEGIRQVFGRKSVQAGVPEALSQFIHKLDEFYSVLTVEEGATENKDKSAGKHGVCFHIDIIICIATYQVFCHDPSGLVAKILEERKVDPETADIRWGLDNGQGWMKLGMLTTDRKDKEETGRAKYAQVIY